MGYVQDELNEAVGPRIAKGIAIGGSIIVVYILVALFWSIWPFSSAAKVVQKVTIKAANTRLFY